MYLLSRWWKNKSKIKEICQSQKKPNCVKIMTMSKFIEKCEEKNNIIIMIININIFWGKQTKKKKWKYLDISCV